MKKTFSIIILVILCGILVGCGQKKTIIVIPGEDTSDVGKVIGGPTKAPPITSGPRLNISKINGSTIEKVFNTTNPKLPPKITQPVYSNKTTPIPAPTPKVLNITNPLHINRSIHRP